MRKYIVIKNFEEDGDCYTVGSTYKGENETVEIELVKHGYILPKDENTLKINVTQAISHKYLEHMNLAELKMTADNENIDITGITVKRDIIKKIKTERCRREHDE